MGLDDAPFRFTDSHVAVYGALVRCPNYLEAVLRTTVAVDGLDATEKVISLVKGSRHRESIQLILIDGISFGGFNVLDVEALFDGLRLPVATVTRDPPDFPAMRRALRGRFSDFQERLRRLENLPLVKVPTAHKPVYCGALGISPPELREALKLCTVRGALPEPLRIAHLIGAGVVRGESRGRP